MTPSMASMFRLFSVICVVIFLAHAVSCIPSREFDSMLQALRARGYDLFSNAIVTSDLQFDLLSYQIDREDETNNSRYSFTFFAPTDASLFALDMTQTASSYTDTLRFHVVPRRLTINELRRLPEGYTLPTILPQRRIDVMRLRGGAVSVGGVEITFPSLFYGRYVAVHGLAGILNVRSNSVAGSDSGSPSPAPVVPPIRSADHPSFSPRSSPSLPVNDEVLGPRSRSVPRLVPFKFPNRRRSSPPPPPLVESPAPGSHDVSLQSPAFSPANINVDTPAFSPGMVSVDAPAFSPVDVSVDAPAPGTDFTFLPPDYSPMNPGHPLVDSNETYPDSEISLPPVGYFDAEVPAPVEMEFSVPKKRSISVMETFSNRIGETPKDSEAVGGVRKCDVRIGFKDYDSIIDGIDGGGSDMQCDAD